MDSIELLQMDAEVDSEQDRTLPRIELNDCFDLLFVRKCAIKSYCLWRWKFIINFSLIKEENWTGLHG